MLKEILIHSEYHLPLITFSDIDIIISPAYIELGKVSYAFELIDQVINKWWWILILLHDGIEGSIVLDEVELTIFLLDKKD
jgi:hypothetical protein